MNDPVNRPKRFYLFPLFGALFVLGASLAVMLLWNAIIPQVIPGIHSLLYWQAIGLLILCRILTGGFRGGGPRRWGGGPPWRNKWNNMSDEEREKLRTEWRSRCGPGAGGER